MSDKVIVDGSDSLDAQNQTLNFYQQQNRSKVIDYVTSNKPQNTATSEILPLGADVPALHLAAIPSGSDADSVQPPNTTLTFENTVYVGSEIIAVAGFHDS